MRILRLVLIFFVGAILTYLTWRTKYHTGSFEIIIWGGLVFAGLLIFIWSLRKDLQLFRIKKKITNFLPTFLGLFITIIILIIEFKIQSDFKKPSLLKVYYNGDYNGTGIDFKKNGTYILDNGALGISDFYYGTYQIDGNKITLDRDQIDNLTRLRYFEIKGKGIEYSKQAENELYLFQVDNNGTRIANAPEFRVVIDNRSK